MAYAAKLPCAACKQPRSAMRLRRGLCRRCYEDPALREAHADRRSPEGMEDFDGPAPEPVPIDADPGSQEKIAAMILRARMRQGLFHRKEPSLPLQAHTQDHAHLWRVLILNDPTILQALEKCVAKQRGEKEITSGSGTHEAIREVARGW